MSYRIIDEYLIFEAISYLMHKLVLFCVAEMQQVQNIKAFLRCFKAFLG